MTALRELLCHDCGRRFWTAFRKGVYQCDACINERTCPPVSHSGFENRRVANA